MAGYQRMVSYLYEYNQGEKGSNVGYAKLEIREDIAKMIVSIRLRGDVTDTCPVGFYYWEGRQAYRVPVGEIRLIGGKVQERILLPGAKAGESELPVMQMNGILISLPEGLIGSAWDEQGVPMETELWRKKKQDSFHAGRGDLRQLEGEGELRAAEVRATEVRAAELRTAEVKVPETEENSSQNIVIRRETSQKEGEASGVVSEAVSREASMELPKESALETNQAEAKTLAEEGMPTERLSADNPSAGSLSAENISGEKLSSEEILPEEALSEEWRPESFLISPSALASRARSGDLQEPSSPAAQPNREMREVPLTEPREGNNYRSKAWMEETQRDGKEARARKQEEANYSAQTERKEETAKRSRRQSEEAAENPIEYFFQQSTKMCPFEDEAITSCVRIEPADLEYFPKETWILGSNSFLLHGYYTYGHLILAKMKGMGRESIMIGVPGLYQNRERFLAKLFGFEYFKPISKTGSAEGDFGYWYLFLPDMQ